MSLSVYRDLSADLCLLQVKNSMCSREHMLPDLERTPTQ
jgi:hypothetical protein